MRRRGNQSYLNKHCDSDVNQNLGSISESTETVDQPILVFRGRRFSKTVSIQSIFPLEFSDMLKTSVRAMEKRHATGQQSPHKPIGAITRQDSTDHGSELGRDPV